MLYFDFISLSCLERPVMVVERLREQYSSWRPVQSSRVLPAELCLDLLVTGARTAVKCCIHG
jgi:hypothetical protein